MTDTRKGRVRGLFGGATPDDEIPDQTLGFPDPDTQRQALQVLVLAQRTADEHLASARHQADRVMADARGAADQVARAAQAHAEETRRDAAKGLSEARAAAEQVVREARAHAEATRRDTEKVVADARAKADGIAKAARSKADALEQDAQQRYDDVVGGLAAKRAALQQQIGALQQFDRDYRARLRTFMHGQLEALGVDEPPPNGEIPLPEAVAVVPGPSRPAG